MNRFKRGLAILLSTCMIGGMMPLPASAEETVSENIVQTECIENTENLENAPSEDEKSSETDHETGSETESETVTDAETEGTAISAIQALIDALPDADSITEDNVENVTSQLDTIDEAKAELSDADMSQLDLTRYDAAINKVMVLMGMKEENDSEIAVQANDSAGKTEQQSTEEEECKHEGIEITFNSNGFENCPKCYATVYQPAVETTDKYDIDDDSTKDTVYEISNAGQLYWFAGLVNGTLDGVEQNTLANAILTANITVNENLLDSLQYDTEGNVSNGSDFITWTPIADWMGNRTTQYSGTFDGNNKIVSGLYFNGDSTCIGLFGSSESDGNIKNVGVVDSYFKGNDHVGGVCGNNAGTITNCYNAGNLTAIESSATVGGICGYNNGGTVTNCYNTGTVTATGSVASVGGVCGCSIAPISNCYNIGTVTATSSSADISGICGYYFGPIKNCYYLADTEDENGGKTTAQFASGEVAYLLSQGCTVVVDNSDVTYDGSIWGQKLGENGDTYPVLDITKRVYQVDKYDGCEGKPGSSTKVYSNQNTSIYEEHKYEADATDSTKHKCSICNGTEEHSFAYEFVENGNAIKATCSECGATYTVKLTQPAATSDEKIVYDGTEKKAGTAIDSGNTGIETIPENAITYAVVTNGTPSTYSTAAPKNAGTYKAKLTLGTEDNRVSIEINFTIEKAASPTIAGEEKSYAYSAGSDGNAIGVDIAGKLPTDRGTTTYAVAETDTEQLLSEVTVDAAGNLTYKVNQVDSSKVGKTAIITVTASMENYENVEYTLTIRSITDKKTVEIKRGNTVSVDGSNVLTYGEKISKLTLGDTVFVEAGTDNKVEGILSWSNPDEVPATGTTQAGWVFKPADSNHYEDLTGTAAITVAKATPIVVTVPTVAEREYNPDAALTGSDMTGGSVTGADGNSLAGTWSFTGTNIVPTVNNTDYQAVFTPNDTNNYNTVTRTITVKVTKATPVIAEKPTAGALTYGQKLSDSTLTGGKAAYQTADGTEITGTFAWKNDTTKPAVVDSQETEYDVTFTPSNKDNYNAVDTKLTLSINKAAAPTMQPIELTVINGLAKTYLVNLPALPTLGDNCEYGSIKYEACNFKLIGEGGYANSTATITSNDEFQLTVPAVESQTEGSVGTVGVKITTDNYQDMLLTVKVIAKNKIVPVLDGEITATPITFGQILCVSTITGTMKDDGKTVEGTFDWTNPSTKPDKAGDYQADWTFTPAKGYEEYAAVTGKATVKVNKATPTFTAPTAQENLTYTGQEQALIIAGSTQDGTMKYRLGESGEFLDSIPNGKDAGTYTVYYKVVGDENHNDTAPASVPVRIGKKPLPITGVTATSKTYDGTTNADIITSVTFDNVTLKRDTDYTVTANFDDASVGKDKNITATVSLMEQSAAAKNYALEQNCFSTTGSITKATAPTVQPVKLTIYNGVQGDYYVDLPPLPTLGEGKSYGTEYYSKPHTINLPEGYTAQSALVADPENLNTLRLMLRMNQTGSQTGEIGTVTIPVTTDNYQDINLIVNVKAENQTHPKVGTFSAGAITYGQALSASSITGTMQDPTTGATVTGTFTWDTWVTPAVNPNAGSHDAKWTFTPDESYGGKYTTYTDTAPVTVNPKAVTVSGITANGKVYDGNTDAVLDCSKVTLVGVLENDTLTVTATGTFVSANAGEQKVTISNLTLGGNSANNYVLAESGNQTETTATITAKEVTVTITSKGGTYGSVVAAAAKLSGAVDGENVPVTLTYIGNNYSSATVPVNVGSYTVTASIANRNYTLTGKTTADFVITPKAVTVSGITAKDKVYDGNTNVVLDYSAVTLGGVLENDTLTVTATGTLESAGVGERKVRISDLTLGGASAANYVLAESGNQTETTANITAKQITVTITPNGGTYGSVVAAAAKLSGAVAGENIPVTLTYTGNGYDATDVPVNVGSYTVTASIANSNYTLTGKTTADFVITPKAVTVSGITAKDKVYDGNTNVVLDYSAVTLGGVLENDTLTVTATGTLESAGVGERKVRISDLTLGGASAANYVLAESGNQTETSATITAKEVTVTITSKGGTYGSVVAAAAKLSGAVDGENVPVTLTYIGNNYSSATVPVNVGSYTVTASIANRNYTLTGKTTADFVITPKAVTVSGITANDKVYDGTTDATLDCSNAQFEGILKNDTLTVTATGTMESADVGEKKVKIFNFKLGGASAANYVLAGSGNQAETTATITAKQITVSITPNGGIYGETITPATVKANDVVGEDTPTITLTYTGTANDGTAYADTTPPTKAGTYTIKAATTDTNYTLDANTAIAEFTVTKRPATVTPDNKFKVYEEKDPDLTYAVSGVLDGETLKGITLTRTEGENAGKYAITATADAGANPNYDVTFAEGTLTIEPKSIKGAKVVLGKALTANGAEQTQTVEKVLLDGREIPADSYTVAGNTATAPDSHTLTITAKGNYTGTVKQTYVIAPAKAEDAPGAEIVIGSGKVKVVVKSEGAVPPATLLTDKAELLAMLVDSGDITADELAQIADGASVDIVLTVKEANVSAEIKTAMAQAAKDYTIGQYLDISLLKYMTVNGIQQADALHTTKDALTISVVVPDALINTNSAVNRTYYIVRNHKGTIDVLDAAFDAAGKTLTFKTDRFSIYAIAYKDTAVPSSSSKPSNNNSSNDSETKKNEVAAPTPAPTPVSTSKPSTITAMPQTGDTFNPTLYVVLLVASLFGLAVVFVCKKRNDK